MKTKLQEAVEAITEAQENVKKLLTEAGVTHILGAVNQDFHRCKLRINLLINSSEKKTGYGQVFGKAKTIFGVPIVKKKNVENPLRESAKSSLEKMEIEREKRLSVNKKNDAKDLAKVAKGIAQLFQTLTPDEIIDSYSDLQIRAVAVGLGMAVDEKTPETITIEFIKDIQETIAQRLKNKSIRESATIPGVEESKTNEAVEVVPVQGEIADVSVQSTQDAEGTIESANEENVEETPAVKETPKSEKPNKATAKATEKKQPKK